MKPKAKQSKYFKAYTNGKPTFKVRDISGVYLIFNTRKKLCYIGYSESCVYKALYRHFQHWKDSTQQRFTYPREYYVRIIFTTPARARLLEKFLILKHNPEDGLLKYKNYFTPAEAETVKKIAENTEPINTPVEDMEEAPF